MNKVDHKEKGLSRIKKRKNVILFLTNIVRSLYAYFTMKKLNKKLTAEIGIEAKVRLMEMQAELVEAGCGARSVSPGKVVAELLLMDGAIEYLKTKLLMVDSFFAPGNGAGMNSESSPDLS